MYEYNIYGEVKMKIISDMAIDMAWEEAWAAARDADDKTVKMLLESLKPEELETWEGSR